jgi:hypothetical protein
MDNNIGNIPLEYDFPSMVMLGLGYDSSKLVFSKYYYIW